MSSQGIVGRGILLAVTAAFGGVAFAQEPPAAEPAPAALDAPADSATAPAASPTASVAAEAAPPAPEPAQDNAPAGVHNRLVEEVIVTANKREENVQDIPQSVTAFSNDKLEAVGIQTVQDLPNITPGLTITNQAGYNEAFLRGVGTDAFLPGADASVPFYLDGIPLLGTQGSSDSLGKIARVEVLKGPQGTLFGTNSVGGAINIVTPDPTHEFSGDAQIGYGNANAVKGEAYVNLPIGDSLAASVAAYGDHQNNFYVNDLSPPMIDVYSYGGRVKLLWDITDNIDNTISAAYNKTSNNAGLNFENTLPAPRVGGVSPIPADPKADRHVDYDGFGVGAVNHSTLGSDTLQWRTSLADLKLIGSWQDLTSDHVTATFGAGSAALAKQDSTNRQYTGELQILSNADTPFHDKLTWVAGAFYIYSKGGLDPFFFELGANPASYLPGFSGSVLETGLVAAGYPVNQPITLYNYGIIVSSAISGYFQGTYSITDELNFILGARYQHSRKQLTESQTDYPDPTTGEMVQLTPESDNHLPVLYSNQLSPRVGLQYRFDNDTQVYASWARGYKTPTYNTVNLLGSIPGPITPVQAQRNDAYELGLKTEQFDRTLRFNTAVFYTKEHNLLTGTVQVLSGGIVNYENTPAARIWGAEFDTLWTPLSDLDPGLAVTASGAYLNTKYTDYPDGRGYDPSTGLAYGPQGDCITASICTGLPLLPARDQTGHQIVRSPPFTGNVGMNQTIPMTDSSLELAVDADYNSGFYWTAQNASIERTFHYYLLNAHATYMFEPWKLDIEAFVKNITQQTYYQTIFVDDFGRSVILNDPRTYGIRLKWQF